MKQALSVNCWKNVHLRLRKEMHIHPLLKEMHIRALLKETILHESW
jgi:hypothetical protein